jgi:hypothetical protein
MLTTILIAATVTENITISIQILSGFLPWAAAILGFAAIAKIYDWIFSDK